MFCFFIRTTKIHKIDKYHHHSFAYCLDKIIIMRVPTRPESYIGHTRPKSAAEKIIVDHNNYWNNRVERNVSAHNFFTKGTVHAERQDVWGTMKERPQSACSSLVSTRGIIVESDENSNCSDSNLIERRARLRKMLLTETSELKSG